MDIFHVVEDFRPVACVNVVAGTDNSCHSTGVTPTTEKDIKKFNI